MSIVEKPPIYQKEHGEIKNFTDFCRIFPKGVTICNGRSFTCTKLDYGRFKNHLTRRGKKCQCPKFKDSSMEKDVLLELMETKKQLKQRTVLAKLANEREILVVRKFKKWKEELKCLMDNLLEMIELDEDINDVKEKMLMMLL